MKLKRNQEVDVVGVCQETGLATPRLAWGFLGVENTAPISIFVHDTFLHDPPWRPQGEGLQVGCDE